MHTTPRYPSSTTPVTLPVAPTVDSLLAHADWVRALARHLVRDPQTADDVEQEVWREALERPPAHGSNVRGWLASVARNAARQLKRGDARRTRREITSARPEALPSTAQLVEEASLSRELAGIVLQLDEPYRTTLLLRYFREMSIDDVARAQDLPRETVRTRQRRGLEILRERLDATRGGRASWIAALTPLARFESAPVAAGSGFAIVGWTVAAAALLATAVWLAWPESPSAPRVASLPAVGESGGAPVSSMEAPRGDDRRRVELAGAATHSTSGADAAAAVPVRRPLAGRLIDETGRPLVGVEVVAVPKFTARVENGEVVVPMRPRIADGTPADSVHDTAGETIYGGETRFRVSDHEREVYAEYPPALEEAVSRHGDVAGVREALLGLPPPRVTARTVADGRFELELAPDTWTFDVADPHRVVVTELGARGTSEWSLVAAPAVSVAGTVVDESGVPVAKAQVQHSSSDDGLRDLLFGRTDRGPTYSSRIAHVDDAGRFDFGRVPRFPRDTISASAPGRVGAQVVVPDVDTLDLRLVLKPRPAPEAKSVLRGIVLHADGRPAGGANVYLGQDSVAAGEDGRFELELSCCHDGMPLAATLVGFQAALIPEFGTSKTASRDDLILRLGPPTKSIRGHVVGPMGKPVARANVQILDGTAFSNTHCYVEDASRGKYSSGVLTDATGSFEIGGLMDRTYRLAAWWGNEIALVSEPVAAGTDDVVLTFDASKYWHEVRGRVVTREGIALPDVDVGVRVDTYRSKGSRSWQTFGRVKTDAQGGFVLRDVPKEYAGLTWSGAGVKLQDSELPADPTREIVLTAELEVRVALEVADPRIDEVRFLDARGEELDVVLQLPDLISHTDAVRRRDGAFPPFDLSDAAVTAVLRSKKTEVRRAPIRVERVATLKIRL